MSMAAASATGYAPRRLLFDGDSEKKRIMGTEVSWLHEATKVGVSF